MQKTRRKNPNIELLYNKALRFLSFRPRAEKEVKIRLRKFAQKQKIQEGEKAIKQAIDKLKEKNLLNDFEFAIWWIKQRIEFKPRGKILLKKELRDKGVEEEIITRAIKHCWREERDIFGIKKEAIEESKLAQAAGRKKLKALQKLPTSESRRKLINFLLRKGFDRRTSRQTTEKLLK